MVQLWANGAESHVTVSNTITISDDESDFFVVWRPVYFDHPTKSIPGQIFDQAQ